MTANDRAYGEQLGEVLRQRSVPALRAFLEAQAGRYGDERQVEAIRAQADAELEMIMHRMTLARADLDDLHAESERWLGEQGVPGPGSSGRPGGRGKQGPAGGEGKRPPGAGGSPHPGGQQRRRRPPSSPN